MRTIRRFLYLLSAIVGFVLLLGWELLKCLAEMAGDVVKAIVHHTVDFWEEIINDLKHMK